MKRKCEICGEPLNEEQERYCSPECQFIACQMEKAKERKRKADERVRTKLDDAVLKAREMGLSYGQMRVKEITNG